MPQKGTHTLDLVVMYHRCPKCDFIFESRKPFHVENGKYLKEETCPRCQHIFEDQVKPDSPLGALLHLGAPTKPEFTWDA